MKRLFYLSASILALTFAFTSCKDDDEISVTQVTVSPATGSVVEGATIALTAKVAPSNASDAAVTWSSSDESVAKVSKDGVVTGVKAGTATIKATTSNKVSGSSTITVTPAKVSVTSVTLSETTLALLVGGTATLTATIVPSNATVQDITWTSSNIGVATVTNGEVKGLAEGTTDITATVDGQTATCKVTVSAPKAITMTIPYLSTVSGSTLNITSDGLASGDVLRLTAVAGTAYTKDLNVTTTSNGGSISLPSDLDKTRSYKVKLIRNGNAVAETWVHPDANFCSLPYALGFYMTGSGKVVADDDPDKPADLNVIGSRRRGYIDANIVDYDAANHIFRIWKGDADKATVNLSVGQGDQALTVASDGTFFDIQNCVSLTDLTPMKGFIDFSGAKTVFTCNSYLTSLDMTMFPNAEALYSWGDPGAEQNKIASLTIGENNKLSQIQLERQSLTKVDLRNICKSDCSVVLDDNKLTEINMGTFATANGKPCEIYSLSAKNNKLTDINIDNCNRIRILKLEGNKIERATLLMQYAAESEAGVPGYLYLFKTKDAFNITWATAAEAAGRERKIQVEYYWWRCYSAGNESEAKDANNHFSSFYTEDEWETNNPVVQALADGFTVECWHSSSWYAPFSLYETHAGGTAPCARL